MWLVMLCLATPRVPLLLLLARLRRSLLTRFGMPYLVLRLVCRLPLRASPRRPCSTQFVMALMVTRWMSRRLMFRRRRCLMDRVMSLHVPRLTFLPSRLAALPKSRLMWRVTLRPIVRPTFHRRPLVRPQKPRIIRAMLPRVSPLVTPLVPCPLVPPMRCLPTSPVMLRVVLRLGYLPSPRASRQRLLTVLATFPTVTQRPRLRVLRPLESLKACPMQRATTFHRAPRLMLLLIMPHLARLLRLTPTALATPRPVRPLESPLLLLASPRRAHRTQAAAFPTATRRTSRPLILARRSRPMRCAMPRPVQ